jgi:hypothetical protein
MGDAYLAAAAFARAGLVKVKDPTDQTFSPQERDYISRVLTADVAKYETKAQLAYSCVGLDLAEDLVA